MNHKKVVCVCASATGHGYSLYIKPETRRRFVTLRLRKWSVGYTLLACLYINDI